MGMLHGSIFEVDTTKMENSYYNINAIVGYNDQSYIKGSYHVDENLYYSLISDRSYALNDSIIAYIFQSDTLYNCLKNY